MLAQETLTLSMPLTSQERSELSRCEGYIEQNLQTLFEVGRAFAQIRDAKLYRETHKTFEEYCIERWKISRPRAYQLIDASVVQENLSTIVDKSLPLPTNEAQTRALKKVPAEKQPELWTKAVQQNNGNAPTAKQVIQIIEVEEEPELKSRGRKPTPTQFQLKTIIKAFTGYRGVGVPKDKRQEALKQSVKPEKVEKHQEAYFAPDNEAKNECFCILCQSWQPKTFSKNGNPHRGICQKCTQEALSFFNGNK